MHEIFGKNVNYINPNNYDINLENTNEIKEENRKQLLANYSWEKSAKELYKFLCKF